MRIQDREKSIDNPYQELHIYYLKGHLDPDNKISDQDFIGTWEEGEFSFLFFSKPSKKEIKKVLSKQPQLTLLDKFHMTFDEWHGGAVVPLQIGSFYITPPWEKMDDCEKKLPIILDPGVAFGTGLHPTTHDCLEALELAYREERIESVLDLGTGTGLLALVAARLECSALAVDYNLLAAQTAKNNVRLNRLEDWVLVVRGRAEDFIDISADLLVTNLHYDVIKHLINTKGFLNKSQFILSGLLRSQAKEVDYILSRLPVTILEQWKRDGIWHTFWGKICQQ